MDTRKGKNGARRDGNSSGFKNKTTRVSAVETLRKLYEEDLKDIYWAENHLVKVLPKMAKAADSEELRTAFTAHLSQTKNHISRLESVFSSSGLKVASKKCEGMEGLTKEGAGVIEDHEKGSVRDAGLIIAAQKVEHYEISAYGSLLNLAKVMGLEEPAKTLQETLNEEVATDRLLSGLAGSINEEAFAYAEPMEEDVSYTLSR